MNRYDYCNKCITRKNKLLNFPKLMENIKKDYKCSWIIKLRGIFTKYALTNAISYSVSHDTELKKTYVGDSNSLQSNVRGTNKEAISVKFVNCKLSFVCFIDIEAGKPFNNRNLNNNFWSEIGKISASPWRLFVTPSIYKVRGVSTNVVYDAVCCILHYV